MTDDGRQIGADLTPREREVLAMVAAGMTNREIGQALFISESTAGVHVSNLMAKLGVGSRTEAASVAYRAGLVDSVTGAAAVAAESETQAAAGQPEPAGRWDRLTRAFNQQVEHHPRRVAAAGFGGLAILFLLTVGLAMAVFGNEPVAGEQPDESVTPQPNASPSPRPTPSLASSPTASPTATPLGGAGVNLEVDGLAQVLADDLSLRTNPGTAAPQIGLVPEGDLGFVVAGPVTEDGFVWYQLAAVDPFNAGCGSPQPAESLACQDWIGWAAAGGTDGVAWLAPHEPTCPAAGKVAGLMALQPLESLVCFGSTPMTLRLYRTANPVGRDCAWYYSVEPSWLGHCGVVPLQATESPSPPAEAAFIPPQEAVSIYATPSLGSCSSFGTSSSCPFAALEGRWLEIVAHFDDPAARNCKPDDASVVHPGPEYIVLHCRARLVVTRITPSDGLGSLDQRQDAWDPLGTIGYSPHGGSIPFNPGVAQIFRAGRTGELTAIQLYLSHLQGSTEPIVVQLRLGSPTGQLLGTSQPSNWPPGPPTGCVECFAWVTVKFDQPPDIEAGQAYAIVFPPGALTGSDNPTYSLATSSQDPYGDGMAMYYGPGVGDSWQAYMTSQGTADLTFRTLVK